MAEALAALRRISTPRLVHHAYAAACAIRLGDAGGAARRVEAIKALRPELTPAAFARELPYRDGALATQLASDLAAAGL